MSGPLVIIPYCITDDADLDCTPAPVAGLGADNLQISDRGLTLRVLADEITITGNLQQNNHIGGAVIRWQTLGGAATWRLRIWDEVNQDGNLVYDSGMVAAIPAKTLEELDWGIDELAMALGDIDYSYLLFEDVIGRSFQIDVVDDGAAFIEIGRLFMGRQISPDYSYDYNSSVRWVRETTKTRTAAGGLRVEKNDPYREVKLALSWILPIERKQFADLLRDTGSGSELWISMRTAAGGALEADYALLGVMTDDPEMPRNTSLRYSLQLSIEES